jgi:aryl-alcohol dehydrogenase-like predicted oxidoreductase
VQYYCESVIAPVFDTANAYGDSEDVLGKLFTELRIDAESCVISKFSRNITTRSSLQEAFQKTLKVFTLTALCFLAHEADVLQKHPDIYNELLRLKEEGYIQRIGISAYFPSEVQWFMNHKFPLDLIQVPIMF